MNIEEIRKANEVAIAILELQLLGYVFEVDGGKVRYRLAGELQDPAQASQYLDLLKSNKEEVVNYFERWSHPFDLAEALYQAALKAYTAGDLPRFARLMAAAMQEGGANDPITWDAWVKSFEGIAEVKSGN